jgi:uncharacterized protein (TIGR02147 family)
MKTQLTNRLSNKTAPRKSSFRSLLQDELILRCRQNKAYSLRSFARALQISPSSLSRLLKGERVFSNETIERLGLKLGLTPADIRYYQDQSVKQKNNSAISNLHPYFEDLSEDAFIAISDWYHYAIMELIQTDSFNPDHRWIARALRISVSEVNVAIERLVRLKLIVESEDGTWKLTGSHTNISGNLRDAAYRNLQKQILTQALEALEDVPIEMRDQSSMTMSIDSGRLALAIEMITKFRRELCVFLESGEKKDEVYQLSISLFPITDLKSKPKIEEGSNL